MERGKAKLQTCSMDESYQSGSLHEIFIRRLSELDSDVRSRSVTLAVLSLNRTCASSSAPSLGVRLTDWSSCGQSKSIRLKERYIHFLKSRGVGASDESLNNQQRLLNEIRRERER